MLVRFMHGHWKWHHWMPVCHFKCSCMYSFRDYLLLKNIVTLKSSLGGHSLCYFMHDLYIAEIYVVGVRPIFLPLIVWDYGAYTFLFSEPRKSYEVLYSPSWSFKGIGICAIRNPICDFLLVLQCHCASVFYRFRVITIYCSNVCVFFAVLPTSVTSEAIARGVSRWFRVKIWSQKNPDSLSYPVVKTAWSYGRLSWVNTSVW